MGLNVVIHALCFRVVRARMAYTPAVPDQGTLGINQESYIVRVRGLPWATTGE